MKLAECSFFADENIHPELINYLRKSQFDIVTVMSEGLIGHVDEEINAVAFKNNRIIITQDQDFGKLIYTTDAPFIGIIYLRPGHFNADLHIRSLEVLFDKNPELIIPFLIVVENIADNVKIRIRNAVR